MPGFELFGEQEIDQISQVTQTGTLMRYGFENQRQGIWKVNELETELAHFLNVKHVHCVSSGTAALTCSLVALGIGYNDEVIVPTFTFIASIEAIISVGAIPVFADIDATLGLSLESIKEKHTSRTKAVMAVHMCGGMINIDEVNKWCKLNQIQLIEDACQSIGGSYRSRKLGTIGDMGCFSFDAVKTITCGEGGAICTHDSQLYQKVKAFSDHGHDHLGSNRGEDQHPYLGYNFRMGELNASIGLAQLHKIDTILSLQKKNYTYLKQALSTIESLQFRLLPDPNGSSHAFLSFSMPNSISAEMLTQKLKEHQVPGIWNYFHNLWHYHKNWDHLKEGRSLYPLNPEQLKEIEQMQKSNFKQSDAIIQCNFSILIPLNWSKDELTNYVTLLKNLISQSL